MAEVVYSTASSAPFLADATNRKDVGAPARALPIAIPGPNPAKSHSRSSSTSSTSSSPLSYIENILRRRSGASNAAVATWTADGYEVLPSAPNFVLTKLKLKEGGSKHLGRAIPAKTGFTLEWSGMFPQNEKAFELKELSPALVQAGRYRVELLWMSDQGEFTNLAACKALEVRSKSGKRVLEKLLDGENQISFTKPDTGLASVWVTLEGWIYRAKDRQKNLMWRVSYQPPAEAEPAFVAELSSSPDTTPASSRRSSKSSDTPKPLHSRSRSLSQIGDVKQVTAVPSRKSSLSQEVKERCSYSTSTNALKFMSRSRAFNFNDEAESELEPVGERTRWEVHGDADDGASMISSTAATTKGDEPDALGLRRGGTLAALGDASSDVRSAVLVQSKTFDPRTYLSTVHPGATFKDLSRGRENLKNSLEQRSEALKVLVEQEFDRFVSVKAATADVYAEMKAGPLSETSDYGAKELKDALKEATSKANQVYTPILDAAMKANRLRSTLTVFERNKFFFNLPGTLLEAVESGRYEAALLAYKKGQYMLDGRPQPLLGLPPSAETTPLQEQQAKRIYDKVWGQVQRVINDLKTTLAKHLRDPKISAEEIDKLINILLELDPQSDPAWIYLEHQHKRILDRLKAAHLSALEEYDRVLGEETATPLSDTAYALSVRDCLATVDSFTPHTVYDSLPGSASWKAILRVGRVLSDAVLATLPAFWKVAFAYTQGKYTKSTGNGRNLVACKTMTNEIIDLYANLLSKFFDFSSSPQQPENPDESPPLYAYMPSMGNALSAAFHLNKMISELNDNVGELSALSLPPESTTRLKDFIATARWKFEDALCIAWIRDSKMLYRLETWITNPDEPTTTVHLKSVDAFMRALAREAYRVAGGNEDYAMNIFLHPNAVPNRSNVKPDALPQLFVERIQSAYMESLYAFLDGLVHVAFSDYMALDESSTPLSWDAARNVRDSSTRILLTISNLAYLNDVGLSNAVRQFERAFRVDLAGDVVALRDVSLQLDMILFDELIKTKSQSIGGILRRGVLESGFDWLNAPKPTEVHAYIYETLLKLVLVHAQTTAVAKPLVGRTLSTLVQKIADVAFECFVEVKRFGLGGMLQATLEIEFLHQTLSQFVTAQANAKLQEIYRVISESYIRKPSADGDGKSELPAALEQVKKTLAASRKATALQFLCFRGPKTKKEPAASQ